MKIIPHLSRVISSQNKKMPLKTVTVINKNGKDIIKDEFVGNYVRQPNFIELIIGLFNN